MNQNPIRILYVDDDPAMAKLAQKRLARAGYSVEIANDGETGMRLYEKGEFDIVTLDYHMPGKSGLDVIRIMTAHKEPVPIIMVTGSGDEGIAVEAMKMGASDYVIKDVDGRYLDLLPVVIEQVLQKRLLQRERQDAINALYRRNQDLALLHETSHLVTSRLEMGQVLEQLLRQAAEIVKAEAGSVWLWESNGSDWLGCRALLHHGTIHSATDLRLPVGEGIIGWVAQNKKTELINNFPGHLHFAPDLGEFPDIEIYNVIAAPIQIREAVLGVLVVSNKIQGSFDENDLFLVETLASTAAIAIENARLFAEVQRLSNMDDLTGLYNRRHFFALAEQEFQRAMRYGSEFGIIMLDVDHFKLVNDNHGHLAGDLVLKAVAIDIRHSVREVDIVGRYGGEEFIILLPQANLFTAGKTAERLRSLVEKNRYQAVEGGLQITISAGVASFAKDSPNIEAILALADHFLYQAKTSGRNKVIGV